MILIFLSSGLFLGWSLGANDGANVFGTAVGSRMLRFKTAAAIAGLFVIAGAVISGRGATETLAGLGAVNAIAGSFMVALAAALAIFWMVRLRIPVSTSQAIVGSILGWNYFTGFPTGYSELIKIVLAWVASPVLAALAAIIILSAMRLLMGNVKLHLLRQDIYTRVALIIVCALGAYSLGANNIANVMGVFVPVYPFEKISIYGLIELSGAQQLFLLGGIAIAIGIFTYSHKVIKTIGSSIYTLSPESALAVVLANTVVLFLFASEGFKHWLTGNGLPSLPLVPVSSTQAIVGGVIGIGILKGARGIRYRVLGEIAAGWIITPVMAGVISFTALFFLQNVFSLEVSREITFELSEPVLAKLEQEKIDNDQLQILAGRNFRNPARFGIWLRNNTDLTAPQRARVQELARVEHFFIDFSVIAAKMNHRLLSRDQLDTVIQLAGKRFDHRWQLFDALEAAGSSWRPRRDPGDDGEFNERLAAQKEYVAGLFKL